MKQIFWQDHIELTRPFKECRQCLLKEQACNRKLRSIVANIIERYLNLSGHLTHEALRDAAIQKEHPLAKKLWSERDLMLERSVLQNAVSGFNCFT